MRNSWDPGKQATNAGGWGGGGGNRRTAGKADISSSTRQAKNILKYGKNILKYGKNMAKLSLKYLKN